jgi:hypothetical protein
VRNPLQHIFDFFRRCPYASKCSSYKKGSNCDSYGDNWCGKAKEFIKEE